MYIVHVFGKEYCINYLSSIKSWFTLDSEIYIWKKNICKYLFVQILNCIILLLKQKVMQKKSISQEKEIEQWLVFEAYLITYYLVVAFDPLEKNDDLLSIY